jgi:hypothetical protein
MGICLNWEKATWVAFFHGQCTDLNLRLSGLKAPSFDRN